MSKKIDISKLRSWEEVKADLLKDPGTLKAYHDLQPEYQLACQIIDARLKKKMSQADLAKKAGTGQAVISRLEGMNAKPSFTLVQKIATALKTPLTFTFSG